PGNDGDRSYPQPGSGKYDAEAGDHHRKRRGCKRRRGERVPVMRISTFWFCLKEGFINMCRNVWFSLASTAIVSACIFLFCVFFSIITNIEYMVTMAETTMGITVFFDEDLSEAE